MQVKMVRENMEHKKRVKKIEVSMWVGSFQRESICVFVWVRSEGVIWGSKRQKGQIICSTADRRHYYIIQTRMLGCLFALFHLLCDSLLSLHFYTVYYYYYYYSLELTYSPCHHRSHGYWPTTFDRLLLVSLSITKVFHFFDIWVCGVSW